MVAGALFIVRLGGDLTTRRTATVQFGTGYCRRRSFRFMIRSAICFLVVSFLWPMVRLGRLAPTEGLVNSVWPRTDQG